LRALGTLTWHAEASDGQYYNHGSTTTASNPDWMASIPDTSQLSALSIPGAHDSVALYGGDVSQCQSLSLPTLLAAGIRALDIRKKENSSHTGWNLYHGSQDEENTFDNVMNQIDTFLSAHPKEVLLMRIQDADSDYIVTTDPIFEAYRQKYSRIWNGTYNPAISVVRGMVVIIDNFSTGYSYGIPYNTLNVQDDYNLTSIAPPARDFIGQCFGTFLIENVLKERMHVQRKETRCSGVRRRP
jgi:1-phosphatidylinositol phosphodiesterase